MNLNTGSGGWVPMVHAKELHTLGSSARTLGTQDYVRGLGWGGMGQNKALKKGTEVGTWKDV